MCICSDSAAHCFVVCNWESTTNILEVSEILAHLCDTPIRAKINKISMHSIALFECVSTLHSDCGRKRGGSIGLVNKRIPSSWD